MHNMDILVLRNLNIFHALSITTFERIGALRITGQFVIGTERVNGKFTHPGIFQFVPTKSTLSWNI